MASELHNEAAHNAAIMKWASSPSHKWQVLTAVAKRFVTSAPPQNMSRIITFHTVKNNNPTLVTLVNVSQTENRDIHCGLFYEVSSNADDLVKTRGSIKKFQESFNHEGQ
jgi:hypothetical protein